MTEVLSDTVLELQRICSALDNVTEAYRELVVERTALLRKAREEGYSELALSKAIGMPKSSVGMLIRGTRDPRRPGHNSRACVDDEDAPEVERLRSALAEIKESYEAALPRGQYDRFNDLLFGRSLRKALMKAEM